MNESVTMKCQYCDRQVVHGSVCHVCAKAERKNVESKKPNFNNLHTLVIVQACIDILHKTRSLSVADVELKNAFEQLCLAKEKLDVR